MSSAIKGNENLKDLAIEIESSSEDKNLDSTLRPGAWEQYIGQEGIKENLKIMIAATKKRNQPLDHLLFYGNPGLGKTTLAHLVAKEMGANIKVASGPAIERGGDLAAILTNLSEGDILFIDEIHRLNRTVEEYLYPAMEDFKLNLILGKGAMAKTIELKLAPFTLIGATTRMALLSAPLRNRFGAIFRLNFYEESEIKRIVERTARILRVEIEPNASQIIARCSHFTPRIANHLLKRARDFAQVTGKGIITKGVARQTLKSLGIDKKGLGIGDRRLLQIIIEKFNGGPVGLQALAAASSEQQNTILDIYEPYLMQIGFIQRTPRGRIATPAAYQYLNQGSNQQNLL